MNGGSETSMRGRYRFLWYWFWKLLWIVSFNLARQRLEILYSRLFLMLSWLLAIFLCSKNSFKKKLLRKINKSLLYMKWTISVNKFKMKKCENRQRGCTFAISCFFQFGYWRVCQISMIRLHSKVIKSMTFWQSTGWACGRMYILGL